MHFAHLLIRLLLWCVLSVGLALPASAKDYQAPSISTIALANLPPEARNTIALIERGGPFPYRRDGIEFQNRERRLPRQPGGYYREYTVPTPGATDRGARRIVHGRAKEYFYTADHYRSFQRVTP